jgi:hypothetical protein
MVAYVFPQHSRADWENCYRGEIIKVTESEGIIVQPTFRAGDNDIPPGTYHDLDPTHMLSGKTKDHSISSCRLTIGEEKGKVKQLKRIRQKNLKACIEKGYAALQKEVGNNPIGGVLQQPTLNT